MSAKIFDFIEGESSSQNENYFLQVRLSFHFFGPHLKKDLLSPLANIAIQYHDVPNTVYTVGLTQALLLGAQTFATPESREAMNRDYGIFTSHTGLGFVVQASAAPTGDIIAMSTAQVLCNSVVPEYLLKNSPLADPNCRCLQVPESFSLHKALIDPDTIWRRGELENGNCRVVRSLDKSDIEK